MAEIETKPLRHSFYFALCIFFYNEPLWFGYSKAVFQYVPIRCVFVHCSSWFLNNFLKSIPLVAPKQTVLLEGEKISIRFESQVNREIWEV